MIQVSFPFSDGSFESVLLASVFTHMPLPEIRNYLNEISRVLSPHGSVLLSVLFSDDGRETVTHDINFWLSKDEFLDAVAAARFHPTLLSENGPSCCYHLTRLANGVSGQ